MADAEPAIRVMENVSQLILRNAYRLPAGQLLLVNPPRDGLTQQLVLGNRPVRCVTQDFGDFRWQQALGVNAAFEVVPTLEGNESAVVLFLPREKERMAMLVHAIASRLNSQSRLWLVGENRGGIKSSPRHLRMHFSQVVVLDNARHCGLFEAAGPFGERHFDLADYFIEWPTRFAGHEIVLRSLPGVFAHGRLDRGTALLLEALEKLRPEGRILDFACGCGVIGVALLASANQSELTLLDCTASAIESSRESLRVNGLQAGLLASDGLAEVSGHFEWIVSNPPFHRGVANDFEVAATFFRQIGTFLAENGKIVIVFNRHLPYFRWLQQTFDAVERLTENDRFFVAQASAPVGSGKPAGKKP